MEDNALRIQKPSDERLQDKVSCLICLQIQTGIAQEAFLAEYGAVRLWEDANTHVKEKHEIEEDEAS